MSLPMQLRIKVLPMQLRIKVPEDRAARELFFFRYILRYAGSRGEEALLALVYEALSY